MTTPPNLTLEPRPPPGLATAPALSPCPDQVQYTNAKVLLVGESGAGKTGLSKVLVGEKWQPSDSTVGAWATQWKLPVSSGDGVEREIWLWDFVGQADQRFIHQLFMDETALAVLVFDGQKEDLFETLGQWDRDLTRASRKAFSKLLVAGRVDAGGLRVSRSQIEAFKKERGYLDFLETSAKANLRCEELKEAMLDGIRWENIPWRSSPAVLVSYRFNGFLDDIYSTLVVRLHHMESFERDQLWRYAADFKTLTGKQLGVKLTRRAEGAGELEVYFDPNIEVGENIIFSKYVHEHLLRYANDVERFRHYVCPHCGTPVGNREVAMRRLNAWLESKAAESTTISVFKGLIGKSEKPTIVCSECENRVPLWDDLEQHFASAETKQRVREREQQSALVLDNESKERALVGEVISTVALAGQLSREFNVSDHGIDMEIEFKSDAGEATGRKVYLLKSCDSHLSTRKSDGAKIFKIEKERHARYWVEQAYPVMLVIRNSEGEIRWMEVRDYLKNASDNGKKSVEQIVFAGERFDVMTVRRWRDKALA